MNAAKYNKNTELIGIKYRRTRSEVFELNAMLDQKTTKQGLNSKRILATKQINWT